MWQGQVCVVDQVPCKQPQQAVQSTINNWPAPGT